jgi:hypothetical protein
MQGFCLRRLPDGRGQKNLCFFKVNATRNLNNIDLFISGIKFFYYLRNEAAAPHANCAQKAVNQAFFGILAQSRFSRKRKRRARAECTKDSFNQTKASALSER